MENANQSIKNRADEVFIGNYLRYPTAMVSGAGCELIDADGNRYLDFLSGIAVCALGHCHPAVTLAISEQAARLVHVSNLYYTEPQTKLAELLVERPAVHLTLCGSTNLNDREKLFSETINKEKIQPPSAERLQKLQQLGNERQENVKNHLVSVGKIAHDRLILCEPEHSDDADAIGGVEISI